MTKNRFRFRAWDKSFQKYCENVIVSTINGEITVYGRLVNGNTALIPSTHVVLEQCTGLKDKNGELIYEGDIVKMEADCMCAYIEQVRLPCIVKWGDFGFYFHYPQIEGEKETAAWNECAEYEVIGNIHENPELLEGK